MMIEGIDETLFRALDRTKRGGLKWEAAQKKGRYVVEFQKWRLRIESEAAEGEHPFKFSIMQPGSGLNEVAAVRSVETDRTLDEDERRLNKTLRELWDLARAADHATQEEPRKESVAELNKALE